jgi:hypothetical protein
MHGRHIQIHATGEVALEQAGAGAFALQIELVLQHLLDFGDDVERANLVGVRMPALGQFAQRLQQPHVAGDPRIDARAQYLYHDLAAIVQRGCMNLGDRGRGQWRFIELGV